ncbi:hypothetical protein KAFR_0A01930 [Kazachstania africana CBS 2517]|uniref:AAA+ ATPase domain-containing protein n=1 Tax=Kazachstania africana (strain ATCC 22294 / BCRC 22015 / CBS 2517 / CECT 1963 / NBRC 1671 / NRRL Y-8276) TaxID=1071382 RepID=H2AMN1_KAZAF|nr:hypothetical protein KAFR_0A01930 [Kazachstania africana CBS 2517]CCF55631.1 hypothetical protein KAFR_0A01930 [Kazachstania africana CBS 2517]
MDTQHPLPTPSATGSPAFQGLPSLETLGESSLFDFGKQKEDTSSGEIINQFISSSGQTVQLQKKKMRNANETASGEFSVAGAYSSNGQEWKGDDSYGININNLLDAISAKSNNDEERANVLSSTNSKKRPQKLWVEKWRPKSFIDLVGNEKTNRRILGWLRQWSYAVFKEQLPELPQKTHNNEVTVDMDPLQRPNKKILLIHGPPGIGKTSVAHVVTKQAGFSVAEINASDERAGQFVKDKVHNTLFNHTFSDSPVCLIADEIDGSVESGFIRVLIDIINKDNKATNRLRYLANTQTKSKDKKRRKNLLVRPIIAICNNLYAPALEKLKQHCEIISFKRPSDNALQERLEHICSKERLDVPIKTINDLIDLAQGDVRNCINNLQFMATNSGSLNQISPEKNDSSSWDTNGKDISISWFKLVNQIFRKDPHRSPKDQFSDLLRQVEMNGNYDRILYGCFTLFPSVKYSDIGVMKPAEISDWLYFHDLMFKSLFEHNGELLRYSSSVPLMFFQKFGDIANKTDLRVKNMDFEQREVTRANLDIVNSICQAIKTESPGMAAFIHRTSLIFEVLPYVDYMISTDLTKIKNVKVKNIIIENLLGILKNMQLTLANMNDDSSEFRTVLGVTPPIHKVALLDQKRMKEAMNKRTGNFQLLLAKSEEKRVKKRHLDQVLREKSIQEDARNKRAKVSNNAGNTIDFFKSQYASMKKNSNNEDDSRPVSNSTKGKLSFISANSNAKEEGDDDKAGHKNRSSGENSRMWIKYKAGFSNAVRKNVTWNSLWQ